MIIFAASFKHNIKIIKMAKKNTILVKLTSTGLNAKGNPTGTFFVKKRNPKKQPEKLSFNKFDPKAVSDADGTLKNENNKTGLHVLFVEKKMPSPKA
jgi:large subunit ribosomal protein L33